MVVIEDWASQCGLELVLVGAVSPWTCQGFDFLGNIKEVQLHIITIGCVKLLPQRRFLLPHARAEWNAHYGFGPAPQSHSIPQDEELMTVERGRRVMVTKLQNLPLYPRLAWTPHFWRYNMPLWACLSMDLEASRHCSSKTDYWGAGSVVCWLYAHSRLREICNVEKELHCLAGCYQQEP